MKFVKRHCSSVPAFISQQDFTPPSPLYTYPVYDGDVFDLGGITIEVIGVPGHTRGSIVLLDKATRILFSGDACNTNTLLYLKGSTSITEYNASLLRLKEFQGEFDKLWGGHNNDPLPPRVIGEALDQCDRIIAGTDDAEEGGFYHAAFYYAVDRKNPRGILANIGYRKDWIKEAPLYYRAPPETLKPL
jgi:glyoxylase-like metal-dependent hydrolase (beta-lactamase superfamily II)